MVAAWHEEAEALTGSPQFLLHEEQEEGASDNKQAAWGEGGILELGRTKKGIFKFCS